MENSENEVQRLRVKCNIQLDHISNLLKEKSALQGQLELAGIRSGLSINPLEAEKFPLGDVEKFFSVFVQTMDQMIERGYIVETKVHMELPHRLIEVAKFNEVRERLYPNVDTRELLRFCIAFGLIQRVGTKSSTVYKRRSDEVDTGLSVRAYRISTELLDWLSERRSRREHIEGIVIDQTNAIGGTDGRVCT